MNNLITNLRVMCVDDHPFMLRTLTTILKKTGVRNCHAYNNPKEAIIKLANEKFDLLITDLQMDGLNGLELIKLVRSGETKSKHDIPIIVSSGLAEAHIIKKAWLLDVSDFVLKPIQPNKLLSKIVKVTRNDQQIKATEDYEMICTSLVHSDLYGGTGSPTLYEKGYYENCPLYSVPENATLSSNLKNSNGGLLLEEGTVLTKELLQKLQKAGTEMGIRHLCIKVN